MEQNEDQDFLRAGQAHARFEDILRLAKQDHISSKDIVRLFNTTYRILNDNWRPIIREELRKKVFELEKRIYIEFWKLQKGPSADVYLEEVLSNVQARIPQLRPTLQPVPQGRYVMVDGEERVILPPRFTMGVVIAMVKNEMDVMKRNVDIQQKSTADNSRSRVIQSNEQEISIQPAPKRRKLKGGRKKYCAERLHVYDVRFRQDFINAYIKGESMPGQPVLVEFDQLMFTEDKARGKGVDDDYQVEDFRLTKLLTLTQELFRNGTLCHFTANGLKRYISCELELQYCLREQKEMQDKDNLPFLLWNDADYEWWT